MDPVRTLLDRELLLSAIVHELRGPITVVQGYFELDETRHRGVEPALERLAALVTELADTSVSEPATATFCGTTIKVKGPAQVLERAVSLLPHKSVMIELQPDHVAVAIGGVPAEENVYGWSLVHVRRWLDEGGPGLAGARLRIAARIVGALRYSFPLRAGETEGVVYIHLARG